MSIGEEEGQEEGPQKGRISNIHRVSDDRFRPQTGAGASLMSSVVSAMLPGCMI
jgi:hypothetical protein